MFLFSNRKLDPIVKLKLKEKLDKTIPVIVTFKEPPSGRFKNNIPKRKGKLKYEYSYMNAIAASFTLEEIDKLSELPEVSYVSYDRKANICMDRILKCVGVNINNPYNLTGRNVNIAVIDTGVYPHGDLVRSQRSVMYFKDFINSCMESYDDNGHGTFISGVIAGSGSLSEGRYRGIAPGSRILMLKAFNSVGEGSFSDILAAIGWVIENKEKFNIKILCLPFGADAIVKQNQDPLCRACEVAWNLGLIVIAASGNKGPDFGSITTPGISSSVITVGCCDCNNSNIKGWHIPDFSGRGSKTEKETKPDFISPGCGITSLSSNKSYMPSGIRRSIPPPLENPYCTMTGSSISAAIAAGCTALYLEKVPAISGNDVKGVLKLSCQTLNETKTAQGSGVIDMGKLINN